MLKRMLKEEAMKKKRVLKEEGSVELSSSPFEQKFAELRPTNSPTSSAVSFCLLYEYGYLSVSWNEFFS
jgi:hypothetical protein